MIIFSPMAAYYIKMNVEKSRTQKSESFFVRRRSLSLLPSTIVPFPSPSSNPVLSPHLFPDSSLVAARLRMFIDYEKLCCEPELSQLCIRSRNDELQSGTNGTFKSFRRLFKRLSFKTERSLYGLLYYMFASARILRRDYIQRIVQTLKILTKGASKRAKGIRRYFIRRGSVSFVSDELYSVFLVYVISIILAMRSILVRFVRRMWGGSVRTILNFKPL